MKVTLTLTIIIILWFALFPISANMADFHMSSFVIGSAFVLIPAFLFLWSDRGAQANRIAYYLSREVEHLINGKLIEYDQNNPEATQRDRNQIFPIENEKFLISLEDEDSLADSFKVYSKKYDVYLLIHDEYNPDDLSQFNRESWYCDQNFNKLVKVQSPNPFNLKRYLIKG